MISSKDLAKKISRIEERPEKIIDALEVFLKERNLVQLMPDVLSHLESISERKEKLKIEAVDDLSNEKLREIREKVGAGKEVEIEFEKNEDLISGFVARYGGKTYDASAKTQLQKLQAKLAA